VSPSRLIDIINERFGGELNEADQLFCDQIAEAASGNESLFIEQMELNEVLFTDYMGKPDMQVLISTWLGSQEYKRLSPGNSELGLG